MNRGSELGNAKLASRIRTAAQAADLSAADLQAAAWAASGGGHESLVAYLSTAADYLRRAADTLDRLTWGPRDQHSPSAMVNTAGAVAVLVVAVVWTPAGAVGPVAAAGLAVWWILNRYIQYRSRSRYAPAAAQEQLDISPSGRLDRVSGLVREMIVAMAESPRATNPDRQQAQADLRAAAGWIAIAIEAGTPHSPSSGRAIPGEAHPSPDPV